MLYLCSKPKSKKVIYDVETRFKNLTGYIPFGSDIYRQAIKTIDHAILTDDLLIETPFGSGLISDLSSGCKAVLLALYYINTNYLVSIEECGETPIKALCEIAKEKDIYVYFASQVVVTSNSVECIVDGVKCTGGTEIYNRTLELADRNRLNHRLRDIRKSQEQFKCTEADRTCTNTVELSIESKTVIELDLEDKLTFIGGDSASGKTYLTNMIFECLAGEFEVDIHGGTLEDFLVCMNERELGQVTGKRHKIIIIDRYDIYSRESKEKLLDAIEKEDNTWLIMTRSPDFEFSMCSFKEIKTRTENGKQVIYLEHCEKQVV